MAKVIFVGPNLRSIINFRKELIDKILECGHEVIVIASNENLDATHVDCLKKIGVEFMGYPLNRSGLNVFFDLYSLFTLYKILIVKKPEVVLAFTIKSVIWVGLISHFFRSFKFFALITGLGYAFNSDSLLSGPLKKIASSLYRISLIRSKGVIFQNIDDLNYFSNEKIICKSKSHKVSGSGVNLNFFEYKALPKSELNFLMVARLLHSKGVLEYCYAAEIMKKKNPELRFSILGGFDPSPDGIKREIIDNFSESGVVEFIGEVNDVRPYIESCHIFVLPSYHEGLPRSTLEAMAMGRPIITTNVSGCRDTVINGDNGYLVEPRDINSLVCGIELILSNKSGLVRMGHKSRRLAVEVFDSRLVNIDMINIMNLS
jgi:glycosyltransferase involved in cell wall biosynthesis